MAAISAESQPRSTENQQEIKHAHSWKIDRFAKEPIPPTLVTIVEGLEKYFNADWKVSWVGVCHQDLLHTADDKRQSAVDFIKEGIKPNSPDIVHFYFRLTAIDPHKIPLKGFIFKREQEFNLGQIILPVINTSPMHDARVVAIYDYYNLLMFSQNKTHAEASWITEARFSPFFINGFFLSQVPELLSPEHKFPELQSSDGESVYVRITLDNILSILKEEEERAKELSDSIKDAYFEKS